jgi:hypothetical protein
MTNLPLTYTNNIITALRDIGELDEEKLKNFEEFKRKQKRKLIILASIFLMLATYRFITQDKIDFKIYGTDKAALVYITLVPLILMGLLRTYSPKLLRIYNTHEFTNATIQKRIATNQASNFIPIWRIEYSFIAGDRLYEYNNTEQFRHSIIYSILHGLDAYPIFLEDNKMPILYEPEHPYYPPHICTKKEIKNYSLRKSALTFSAEKDYI